MKDYYYILGVDKNATSYEIRKAFRKLSIKFHPDKNKGDKFFEERFKDIQEAYETLSNIIKKKEYDRRKNSSYESNGQNKSLNLPQILQFNISPIIGNIRDTFKISWKVENSIETKISLFGAVPNSGVKKIQLKNKHKALQIYIIASNGRNKAESIVTISVNDSNKKIKPLIFRSIAISSLALFLVFILFFNVNKNRQNLIENIKPKELLSKNQNDVVKTTKTSKQLEINSNSIKGLGNYLKKYPKLNYYLEKEVIEDLYKLNNRLIDSNIWNLSSDGNLYTEIMDNPSLIIVNDKKYRIFKCENIERDLKGGRWGLWGEISCSVCSGSSGYIAIAMDDSNMNYMNMSLITGDGYGITGYKQLEMDLISMDILLKDINNNSKNNYELASNSVGLEQNTIPRNLYRVIKDKKYGFLNRSGEEVIPCIYDDVSIFKNGKAIAKINKNKFYITTENEKKPKLHKSYSTIQPFSEFGFSIVTNNEFSGIIDTNGIEIIPTIYEYIEETDKHFIIRKNNYFGVFNKKGRIVIPFEYTFIEPLYNYFFVAKDGQYIPPYRIDPPIGSWNYQNDDNGKDGLCGLINMKMEYALPLIYQNISKSYSDKTIIYAEKNNKNIIFDLNLNCLSGCNEISPKSNKQKYHTTSINNNINDISILKNGISPYKYCYGNQNTCSHSCSKILVKASYNSDVIILIKKNGKVLRNTFISKGMSFEFNLPNGIYQTFFYYGSDWDNKKYMKETSSGSLYGGFTQGEHFGKDFPQYLENNILTYELILQQNGNFNTKSSNLNEAL